MGSSVLWVRLTRPAGAGDQLVNWSSFNEVVIVEGEDNPVGEGGKLVDQGSQDGLVRRRLRGLKCIQRSFSDVGLNTPRSYPRDGVGTNAKRPAPCGLPI